MNKLSKERMYELYNEATKLLEFVKEYDVKLTDIENELKEAGFAFKLNFYYAEIDNKLKRLNKLKDFFELDYSNIDFRLNIDFPKLDFKQNYWRLVSYKTGYALEELIYYDYNQSYGWRNIIVMTYEDLESAKFDIAKRLYYGDLRG